MMVKILFKKVYGLKQNYLTILMVTVLVMISCSSVFAATDTTGIDKLIDFIAAWVVKLGGVIAFIGGIMFAIAFKNDDANGKTNGIKTAVAGFMLVGIGLSKSLFGL